MGTLVQSVAGVSAGAVLTCTPGAGVTSGNAVVVAVQYGNGSALTVASVTNQSGTALTYAALATAQFDGGNGAGTHLLLVQNCPALTAVKVTLSSTPGWDFAGVLAEWSGIKTSGAADATGKNAGTATAGTTADEITSGSLTPTSQPGVLVAVTTNCSNTTAPTAGTGFTSIASMVGLTQAGRFEYKAISATSATAGTFTNASGGGQTFTTLAAVILDATGGGSAVTGTGALVAATASMSGAGVHTLMDTGSTVALIADVATLAGSGTVTPVGATITGTGALIAGLATMVGSGVHGLTGSGALATVAAVLTGVGTIGAANAITGTGALLAAAAVLDAIGPRGVIGSGSLVTDIASIHAHIRAPWVVLSTPDKIWTQV